MMEPIRLFSPAKINLHLRILGKRRDGYHDISTLFVATDFGDDLSIEPANDLSLECRGEIDIPVGNNNLIAKSARLLAGHHGVAKGARIVVEKRIPTGGGLGGGSSNAATALLGLNHIWQLGLSLSQLMEYGAALGSDVPFFLLGAQAAIGTGRGEKLVKVPDFPDLTFALCCPNVSVSTKWAYQQATNLLTEKKRNVNLYGLFADYLQGKVGLDDLLCNDFEEAVFPEFPQIAAIKRDLLDYNALGALLSGSGSTVVGLFENEGKARAWMERARSFPTYITKPLSQMDRRFFGMHTQEE